MLKGGWNIGHSATHLPVVFTIQQGRLVVVLLYPLASSSVGQCPFYSALSRRHYLPRGKEDGLSLFCSEITRGQVKKFTLRYKQRLYAGYSANMRAAQPIYPCQMANKWNNIHTKYQGTALILCLRMYGVSYVWLYFSFRECICQLSDQCWSSCYTLLHGENTILRYYSIQIDIS